MVLKFIAKRGYDVLNYDEIPEAKREKHIIKYLNEEQMADFLEVMKRPIRGYPHINILRNVAIVTLSLNTPSPFLRVRSGNGCGTW